MVIMIYYTHLDVKKVLIDPNGSNDILFQSTFKGLQLDPHNFGSF